MDHLKALAALVSRIHQQADAATSRFALDSGFACPPGCGACCLSPNVEASALDMLPAALALFEQGVTRAQVAEGLSGRTDCHFFQRTTPDGHKGRCGLYPHRGLVCRLFGFSQRRNKQGEAQLVVCRVMRDHIAPTQVQQAERGVSQGTLQAPQLSALYAELRDLDPAHAEVEPHINQALLKAMERVERMADLLSTPPWIPARDPFATPATHTRNS